MPGLARSWLFKNPCRRAGTCLTNGRSRPESYCLHGQSLHITSIVFFSSKEPRGGCWHCQNWPYKKGNITVVTAVKVVTAVITAITAVTATEATKASNSIAATTAITAVNVVTATTAVTA